MILTHIIKIGKLTNDNDDSDKEGYVLDSGYYSVNIQPASAEQTVLVEGVLGKTYRMYAPTTASGINDGNLITVVSGTRTFDEFIVKGKENWNMGGPLPHYEFTLTANE